MAKNLTVLKMADNATTKVTSLIINKVSRNKYKALSDASAILDSELYVVKDVTLNAVKKPVSNVIMTGQNEAEVFPATPNPGLSEAANKKYVDDVAKDIKENLIGSLIYKGHITLGIEGGVPSVDGEGHLVAGSALKDIFCAYIKNTMGKTEAEALEYEIGNGSTYQFTFSNRTVDTEYTTTESGTGGGIKITNKDYIIINNHVLQGKVKVKDINRDNIDIIDIKYDTLVQRAEFDAKVTELQNADTALGTRVTTNETNIGVNTASINAEVTARGQADTALQNAISAENTRAVAAEEALGNRVDDTETTLANAVLKNASGGIAVAGVDASSLKITGSAPVVQAPLAGVLPAVGDGNVSLTSTNLFTVGDGIGFLTIDSDKSFNYNAGTTTTGKIDITLAGGTDAFYITKTGEEKKSLKTIVDGQIDAKLNPAVTALQGSITTNANNITTNTNNISTLQGTVNGHGTRLTTAEGNITNLGTSLTNLSTTVNNNYNTLDNKITQLGQQKTQEINTAFTNIKEAVKGQNLKVDVMTDSEIRNCIALLWEFFGGTVIREYTSAEYSAGVKVGRVKTDGVWSAGTLGVVGKSYKVVIENGVQYWTTEFTGV